METPPAFGSIASVGYSTHPLLYLYVVNNVSSADREVAVKVAVAVAGLATVVSSGGEMTRLPLPYP